MAKKRKKKEELVPDPLLDRVETLLGESLREWVFESGAFDDEDAAAQDLRLQVLQRLVKVVRYPPAGDSVLRRWAAMVRFLDETTGLVEELFGAVGGFNLDSDQRADLREVLENFFYNAIETR